ncbi:response regulator [Marinobacter sp.]|uniref:response regulator n=1 Tax=Marinobacter sp. TaxID=50741 RepID=UPI002B4A5BE1|nr:response regulator [Marinobacter sp.]HKK56464.1 response regulator [Marinobacter sp.]
MKVLILEDDMMIADLLETVVSGLYPGLEVQIFDQVDKATAAWLAGPADLVITDWNLPDGSGLTLVKAVRDTSEAVPVVVVTARSDRNSILTAASLGISSYIIKPFSVELLHERLGPLIAPFAQQREGLPDLGERLQTAVGSSSQLPGLSDAGTVLKLLERQNELAPAELAERWKREPAIVAKLLGVANGSSLRRSGQSVLSVKDAITKIGVPMALNQALALSLDIAGQLPDQRLKALAQEYQAWAEKVALEAQRLAMLSGSSGELHFTAGLLSRVGELVALKVIQQHVDAGADVSDAEIDQAIGGWAQKLGNSMKIQWRLPLELRGLVGAIHLRRRDSVTPDHLIMGAAAMLVNGMGEDEEYHRLLRLLGIADQNEEQPDAE